MNVRDSVTGIVHRIVDTPLRPANRSKTQGREGLTGCMKPFRWWGQSGWLFGELSGDRTKRAPTCLFCVSE